ncbi:MAG: four helix bundle protein [Candidatus Saccharimonadales bacterium]
MATHDYRDLQVWQRAIDFVVSVYELADNLPKHETYALADQLRRSAVSIPSNIAEGQKRLNIKETIQFTGMALGSTAECQTQLIIIEKVHKIDTKQLVDTADIIGRMLTALIKSLKSKI